MKISDITTFYLTINIFKQTVNIILRFEITINQTGLKFENIFGNEFPNVYVKDLGFSSYF